MVDQRFAVAPHASFAKLVQIWQGNDVETALCLRRPIVPPSPLCFERNPEKSIGFLHTMRLGAFAAIVRGLPFVYRPKRRLALPRISGYTDFSRLEDISTSAAVVLAADFERLRRFASEVPPTVNLDSWNPQVFTKLFQLGFFEIVGLAEAVGERFVEQGDTLTMRIISAERADRTFAFKRIDEDLTRLMGFLGPAVRPPDSVVVPSLTALSEAISNVTGHAYEPGLPFEYRHINRFWIAATADRSARSLTVVVYDQGATIPVTYPRVTRMQKVERFLRRGLRTKRKFDFEDDGTYIRSALRYGGSRTGDSHRGKGLPQMVEVLRNIGNGHMTIWSRGGWCHRAATGRMSSGALPYSIGGTLIEWSLFL